MPARSTVASALAVLLAAGAAAAQPAPPAATTATPVDAEIVLAVDASRSMDLTEFAVQREGYMQALRHPDLMRAVTSGFLGRVAIAYFEWSGDARDGGYVPWRIIDTPEAAQALADAISVLPISRSRGTSISRAITFGTALIEDGTVDGVRRIIDISGDGANNIGPPVTGARDVAIARGITINGLPVIMSSAQAFPDLDFYYEDCVIGGEGAFLLVARSPEEFAGTIRRKLILEIAGYEPEAEIVPAQFASEMDCLIGEKLRRDRGFIPDR